MPIELPQQDPCVICEGLAGHLSEWVPIEESELTLSLIPDIQFEVGQCLIVPKRHVALLTDLTDEESVAIMSAARKVMRAIVAGFEPLGVFIYQNNGVYSGQMTPHYHMHVVPRQPGSDWGVGPPHFTRFEDAGRAPGTVHDASGDEARLARQRAVTLEARREAAERIRAHLS
ncbi:MAG TPA: HIT family protein [Dehalococcoidia bacterium]|nr:HIT family protein [Dehalococcoidia bacterium]